jgi:hemerythrin superfamily protein
MEIYEALKKDHREVQGLLEDLVSGQLDIKECKILVGEIRDALIPHSRAEEAVFYNSIRDIGEGGDIIPHAYKEHMMAETLLRTLQALEVFDTKGLEIAKKLKIAVEHHIADEESRVFPIAKAFFTEREADEFGQAFEKLKPEIKEQSIAGTTWDLVVNLMPQRFRGSIEKYKTNAPHTH